MSKANVKQARARQGASRSIAAGATDESQPAPKLGDCLRSIRFERGLSLAEISAATGIAGSTLSRVERGQLSLTYDKLVQLSRGLGIDIADLLSSRTEPKTPPILTRRAMTAPGEGQAFTVGSSAYRYMCTELSAKRMTPMVAEIRARSVAATNGLLAHPGEEFTYVLSGTVQLHTEFYEPLTLVTGACVYFDSTMRHTYVAVGDAPAEILCVCSVDDFGAQHALPAEGAPKKTAAKRRRPRRPAA